ncbi:PQQ-dependent sugar dehydrogenase [Schlesneria paludicola]|uniref:PQQ-dependent sugar dehydrogenase n=1 Tax=Schlesneria paludicola TaxID=360056 RepID=UPI000299FD9E|nr:PQQ-dependent sugar dehydrogenase [Schlesneria paludicola]
MTMVLALMTLVSASNAETSVDQSRFETTILATGLVQPMELAIAPDGSVYFIELSGKLKVLKPGSREVTLVGEVVVTTAQENGLIGLTLDPNFASNQWIYFQYSPPDFPGQYVSRFTLKDGKLDLSSEKVLLKYEEQRKECCHHAGALQFGPGGELFIASGDNTNPFGDSQGYAPIDERPDHSPFDAQRSSGNTNSYNGKILRIKPKHDGTYEIPEGNLFPADGSQGHPEIYVMGCRNPWRISVDPATGFLYWGDVGPDAGADGPRGSRGYDEINQARKAGNFGWPYFVANNRPYAHVNFETGEIVALSDVNGPKNDSPNNTGAKVLPVPQPAMLFYPYGDSPEFPELGKGGRTACAGPVYHFQGRSDSLVKFPAEYDRCLFIFEWSRNWLKVVFLDDQQNVKRIEPFLPEQRFVRPIDLEFGPEGSLYAIEYGETWGVNQDARLIRIDFVRGNRPPVVVVAAENNLGKHPLKVSLSSQGTFDKDVGDQLSYEWRAIRAGDANAAPKVVSREPNPTITMTEPGVYNLELVVTDAQGAFRSATVPVIVGNERPTIRFSKPASGEFYDADQPIRFELTVNDVEDGSNDDDEVDKRGAEPIDGDSPKRVSLNAAYSKEPIPTAGGATESTDQGPMGLRRMKGSDCFNCHAVDQKRVGPPLLEIATKYRTTEGALDASVQRVLKGSTGVWGKIPMIPHSQHTLDEIREMVEWVYSLQPRGLVRVFNGFVGEIPVSTEEAGQPGHYKLEANYVDRGAEGIPPLNASAVVYLRHRMVEAESADEVHGPRFLNSNSAGGGRFAGSIDHGHYLRFNGVTLDRVKRLTFRVASAGQGGVIDIRMDRPDGPRLASVSVEVNGAWETWYEKTIELPSTTGRHDLFVRFENPEKTGGLMNLDSIYFHP